MSKKKIVIADDEAIIVQTLTMVIMEECSEYLEIVATFDNGKDVITYIKNNLVDIVLTDIKMPMADGIDVLRDIYENGRDIKTIMITGYREFEYAQKALNYGCNALYAKPLDYGQLLDKLNELCQPFEGERAWGKQTLDDICDYMYANCGQALSMSSVADQFQYNYSYFSRMFQKECGKSFVAFLKEIRLKKGVELLCAGDDADTAAAKVGYDVIYFKRMFKSQFGMTVKQFISSRERQQQCMRCSNFQELARRIPE